MYEGLYLGILRTPDGASEAVRPPHRPELFDVCGHLHCGYSFDRVGVSSVSCVL